jgi:hypothetical protein
MALSRKRKKNKSKKLSFKLGGFTKRRKRHRASWFGPSLIIILKVLAVVCVISGIVIGLMSLEKYVKETIPTTGGLVDLELAGVPLWTSDELKEKVREVVIGKVGNGLSEDIVPSVQHNLERLIPWLDDVKVRFIHDRLRVEGRWRKPIGLLKFDQLQFYVDAERVVLDHVSLPDLPIVEIKGLPLITKTPPLGEVWQRDDLAAAVMILDRLDHMDKTLTPEKPLLNEIDRIDVSNFNGRQNSRLAHIILYSKDDSQIIWGAEVGKWQRHLESTDQEKLAKLYGYYKDYGTLSGGARYINLRDPRDKIPLPIDKY